MRKIHGSQRCLGPGYLSIQKQNKNSKKLPEEKLSENGLSRYTKFGRAHLND